MQSGESNRRHYLVSVPHLWRLPLCAGHAPGETRDAPPMFAPGEALGRGVPAVRGGPNMLKTAGTRRARSAQTMHRANAQPANDRGAIREPWAQCGCKRARLAASRQQGTRRSGHHGGIPVGSPLEPLTRSRVVVTSFFPPSPACPWLQTVSMCQTRDEKWRGPAGYAVEAVDVLGEGTPSLRAGKPPEREIQVQIAVGWRYGCALREQSSRCGAMPGSTLAVRRASGVVVPASADSGQE